MPARKASVFVVLALILIAITALPGPGVIAGEIHEAAFQGDLATVKSLIADDAELLDARDEYERTPLHWACRGVHLEVARYLIEAGADINAKDANIITPLHSVASRGHRDATQLLLDSGAIVDSPDYEEHTALHYAAREGHSEVVALLLARGANIEARNVRQRTPLILAAREHGDARTARVLIEAGADVDAKDRGGESSLALAAWRGFREFVDVLMDEGAEVPVEGFEARLLIQFAANRGLGRLFNHMAANGADLTEGTDTGGSLLHAACQGGSQEIVRTLLDRGMDMNEPDNFGVSPIHNAAEMGRVEVIDLLAAEGADIDIRTPSGKTPLNIAQEFDRRNVVELLVSLDADQSPPRFPVIEGPYLGQEPPGPEPKIFALGIVSTNHHSHSSIAFSPDGKEAYWTPMFSRPEAGYGHSTVFYTKMVNGRWTLPKEAPFSKGEENRCDVPFFSPDGDRLYFISRRPVQEGGPTSERIWFLERDGDGWSEPKLLDTPANDMDIHWQFSMDMDGNLYFGASSGQDIGAGDIYLSRFVGGEYLEPENPGDKINSTDTEFSPFIAPDGSYLIFARVADGGIGLFISFRNDDGTWTEAVNMGSAINGSGHALCPLLSPDGEYLFYMSARDGIEGIYWVDAGIIEQLRN